MPRRDFIVKGADTPIYPPKFATDFEDLASQSMNPWRCSSHPTGIKALAASFVTAKLWQNFILLLMALRRNYDIAFVTEAAE